MKDPKRIHKKRLKRKAVATRHRAVEERFNFEARVRRNGAFKVMHKALKRRQRIHIGHMKQAILIY